jgi:hypothetical protein
MNADSVQNLAGIAGALAVVASILGRLFPWRIRLGPMMAVLWIAFLLLVLGYAAVHGETGFSDFGEIGIFTGAH